MKRIKSLNGYTIYEYTKRDSDCHTIGEYAVYFSSDIRDYGLSNSYAEFEDVDSLDVALELCGDNTAKAKEICEEKSTCVSFEEIEKVKNMLDKGISEEEIENMEIFEELLTDTEWFDGEIIIAGLESEFSFVWDNDYAFTEYGKNKFKNILPYPCKIDGNLIEVFCNASENEVDFFNACVAGYISDEEYNKILTRRK